MNDLGLSSLLGVLQGAAVTTFVFPLDAIKTRQQSHQKPITSFRVAVDLFRTDGVTAFFRGIKPELVQCGLKQTWCWPMMTGIPRVLEKFDLNPYVQQLLTGAMIAPVDGITSKAFNNKKILGVVRNSTTPVWKFQKAEWRGFSIYWFKKTVNWSTFLVSQKFFRDRIREKTGIAPTYPELIVIGAQTAFVVSVVSSPIDVANTFKQLYNTSVSKHITSNPKIVFRGLPMSIAQLVIKNISSVILLEKLGQSTKQHN